MEKKIKVISDLTEGDVVVGANSGDYSMVKECVHGNMYYAFIGANDEDVDLNDIITVSDDDSHCLGCCN